MWAGSGIAGVYGSSPVDGLQSGHAVQEKANESALNQSSIQADSTQIDDGSIFGLIVTGIRSAIRVFVVVFVLPAELERLGFPRWAAYPMGIFVQLVVSMLLVQLAMNRWIR